MTRTWISKLMLTVLILILSISTALSTNLQEELLVKTGWRCTFGGQKGSSTLYTFKSDQEAQAAVAKIVKHTGIAQNFIVAASDVDNAEAFIQDNKRYVLYNQQFMLRLVNKAGTDWAAIGVMAHEIGHHLQGHTVLGTGSQPKIELEADRYAGFVLQKMGASLEQAVAGWKEFSNDEPTPTHPGKKSRIAAVTNGWSEARELSGDKPQPEPVRYPDLSGTWRVATLNGRPIDDLTPVIIERVYIAQRETGDKRPEYRGTYSSKDGAVRHSFRISIDPNGNVTNFYIDRENGCVNRMLTDLTYQPGTITMTIKSTSGTCGLGAGHTETRTFQKTS